MSKKPQRIVDCHVHLWDPARTDWYPYLSGRQQLNMGDTTGMQRLFDVPTYESESAGWNVEKLVNVAAATGMHSVDETLELDGRAGVDGIVGGLPPTDSVADAIAILDKQMQATKFRGVRPMGQFTDPLPAAEVLRALAERGLVFELMARTDALETAARGLSGHEELTVVVEHTGWPRSADADEFVLWRKGIDALAASGENVVCKLSGLAMPLGSMSPGAYRRWIDHAIAAFGVDRCLFASNFPVDGMHGTLDELFTTFSELTVALEDADRDKLFAANAERVYRI
ncbi:MAG TPA: amidohydrolase family protein [Acidimicrobiales bacterium]|nr:amidohydrolase family protein [Acidimicrobiales bacterium]